MPVACCKMSQLAPGRLVVLLLGLVLWLNAVGLVVGGLLGGLGRSAAALVWPHCRAASGSGLCRWCCCVEGLLAIGALVETGALCVE